MEVMVVVVMVQMMVAVVLVGMVIGKNDLLIFFFCNLVIFLTNIYECNMYDLACCKVFQNGVRD